MYTTKLKNKIKIISPGIDQCSGIMGNNCGIGLHKSSFDFTEFKFDVDYNTEFDIFIWHYFWLMKETDKINSKKVKCKKIIIDSKGEWVREKDLSFINKQLKRMGIESEEKLILGITDEKYKKNFLDWKYIPTKFSPKFFIHNQNDTFSWTGVKGKFVNPTKIFGTKKVKHKKEYPFMCLNNAMRPHRVVLCDMMIKDGISNLGIFSSNSVNTSLFGKRYNIPKINAIGDDLENWENEELRFNLQPQFSDKAYIDVVVETQIGCSQMDFNTEFCTEKPLKPFLSLQFPIILGYSGIYEYLRGYGFDMFDDIIDNSHDSLEYHHYNQDKNNLPILEKKCQMIVNELKRLCTLDLHDLYEKNFDRLLANQKLINKYQDEKVYTKEILSLMFDDNILSIEQDNITEEIYV